MKAKDFLNKTKNFMLDQREAKGVGAGRMGIIGGTYLGYKAGKGLSHITPSAFKSRELRKQEDAAYAKSNKDYTDAKAIYDPILDELDWSELGQYDDMTVGELDAHIKSRTSDIFNKTASAKQDLVNIGKRLALFGGVSAGASGALSLYAHNKNNNDPSVIRKRIGDYQLSSMEYKTPEYWMSDDEDSGGGNKHPASFNKRFRDVTDGYPSSSAGIVDDYLKVKGIDPYKMKVKDYRTVLDLAGEDAYYEGEINRNAHKIDSYLKGR